MQSVLLIIVALPKQFKSWLHLASAHIRNMGISLSKPTSCQSKGTQTQMDVEYSDDTHVPLRNRQSKFCSAITISASHHCSIRVSMDLAYLAEMRKISDPTSLPFFSAVCEVCACRRDESRQLHQAKKYRNSAATNSKG